MTDEKTDVDYFVQLAGTSSCCEEGFRQGVHFMAINIIPHKIRTAERLAKIAVLEEVIRVYDFDIGGKAMNAICEKLDELKAGN